MKIMKNHENIENFTKNAKMEGPGRGYPFWGVQKLTIFALILSGKNPYIGP